MGEKQQFTGNYAWVYLGITARLCRLMLVLSSRVQDSHFIYSFSPIPGINKLFIRLAEAPTAKVTHTQ